MTGRARGGGNGRPITVIMQRPRDGSSGSPKKYRLKQYRTVIVSAPSAATDRLLARAKQQTNCPGLATIAAAIALLLAPHGTAVRAERSLLEGDGWEGKCKSDRSHRRRRSNSDASPFSIFHRRLGHGHRHVVIRGRTRNLRGADRAEWR